jgi:uncharacterized protein HemY
MGKILIIIGAVLIVVGLALHFAPKMPWPGKLPGDIVIDRGNFKVYFPITTSILLSLLLTLVLYLVNKAK